MMKQIINLLLISVLSICSFSSFAVDYVTKAKFRGSIKGGTCKIVTSNLNVDLGTWLLTNNGSNFPKDSTTDWVEFDLSFNCGSDGSQISGKLEGTPASDRKLFELDDIAGKATGMAIEIEAYSTERNRWEAKSTNQVSVLLSSKAASTGSNNVKFRARYKQLGSSATAGKANASITFVVQNN
ncbi:MULTISPECIES: fimbrial protein [Providencia]|uniref:Fimbrial-type adhesion domain-containing protein n=2 Tax=Providencia heimbachae TaxID=333962 RepID=A0A1B7JML3_9GAMM|nr:MULTISPECIES: fimbrial protein [Providencia]MBP6122078.1 fimbrial protein [Providencia sp.]NIH21729.1 fimbrial protein [Providencia heimbachae]OAT49145.1 hypothetical protein M998_3121 [Providencia heimbachae ATCC 35613]SQH12343.1 long polar fimbrial protein LpfE [Providencia heimbachae]